MTHQKLLIQNTKTATIEKAIKASEIVVDTQKAILSQFWDSKKNDYKLYIPFQIITSKALTNRYSQSGDKKHLNLVNRTSAIVKVLFGDSYDTGTIELAIAHFHKQLYKLYSHRVDRALSKGKSYIWLSSTTSLTGLFEKSIKRYCVNLNSETIVDTTDVIHSIFVKLSEFGVPWSEIEKASDFVGDNFKADYKRFKEYYNSQFAVVINRTYNNSLCYSDKIYYHPYLLKNNKLYMVDSSNAITKTVKNIKTHNFKYNYKNWNLIPVGAENNIEDVVTYDGDKIIVKSFLSVYDLFYKFANQAIANERRYKIAHNGKGDNKEFISLDSLKENGFDIGKTSATITDKLFIKEFTILAVDTLQWHNVKKETARKFVKAFVFVNYVGTDIKDTCKQVGISWNSYYRLKAILENDSNIILTYK